MDRPDNHTAFNVIKETKENNFVFKRAGYIAISLLFTGLLGYVDYQTGPLLSFHTFYLLPVGLITWYFGKWYGVIPLAASVMCWVYDDVIYFRTVYNLMIPFWNIIVKTAFFIFMMYVMSALKEVLDRERLFSRIDHLTETANKRHFYESVEKEITRADRYRRPLSVAYIDLDNFKTVNDDFGHMAGDEVLKITAEALKKGVRQSDTVARIGGDEFGILFPETDSESARMVINRIQAEFQRIVNARMWPTTLSIGVLTCQDHRHSLESVITTADSLMYAAKKEGKNRVKYETFK